MQIGNKEATKIVIVGKDDEVLAVIMDEKIVEKDIEKGGVSVVIDWKSP